MKLYKKIILFILLFLFVLCLKTTVFGLTLTEIEYNGVIYKPDIEPLTLETTTNSYIVSISRDLSAITVVEPYNSDDYLVAYTSKSLQNGTYNRIAAYEISSKSLTDVCSYTSVYSNGAWSSWEKNYSTELSSIAPGNTSSYFIKKCNIALYIDGLGIVGNDVITSGIPLPSGLSLCSNIIIMKYDQSYWLRTSGAIDNYFEIVDDKYYCKTPASSNATFGVYHYQSSSKSIVYDRTDTSGILPKPSLLSVVYSYNNYIINGTVYKAYFNFFNLDESEVQYTFPYIADTDEVLSNLDNIEEILIFPGNVTKENLPLNFYLFDVTNNKGICSISLDTNSPYYHYIAENPSDYWFEIPTSEFKDYLVNGNQYSFNIIARNNVNEFTISRPITYGGTTGTPPTEEDKQTDAIINQTEKIEEQTNAIINQTEKIEEQTEVQKSIFERIGDILSYINPLSENFFAYKLINLLIDALKSLFVPEERFF